MLWREIRTRAYGRKVVFIKAAYVALAAAAVWMLARGEAAEPVVGSLTAGGVAFVALAFMSLMLVNAQSVTSLTGERDGRPKLVPRAGKPYTMMWVPGATARTTWVSSVASWWNPTRPTG